MSGKEGKFTVAWVPPILTYCGASIAMTLTNKMVLSSFHYKMPFMMLAVQSFVTVALLETAVLLRLVKPHRRLNRVDVKRWIPVSLLMAVMLFTGSKSLQFLSVPVFTIFKNLSIIVVAWGESKLFGSHVTRLMLISFALMVVSSIIAAESDFNVTAAESKQMRDNGTTGGYAWMLVNCLSSAAFVLYMRFIMKFSTNTVTAGDTVKELAARSGDPGTPFKDYDTVYYNNMLTAPLFAVMSLLGADGSLSDFYNYYYPATTMVERDAERQQYIWALLFSGCSAFFISYASAWCIRVTNSTTYSMVGALNKLPIAISGLLFFADAKINVGTKVLSIAVGFVSGLLYTIAKIRYDAIRSSQSIPK